MPSSKNYKRDYKQEYANDSKERRHQRSERNQARHMMMEKGKAKVGDGKDVGHKKALSRGGANTLANLAMQTPTSNRSFKRKSSGAMASETSKKESRRKK